MTFRLLSYPLESCQATVLAMTITLLPLTVPKDNYPSGPHIYPTSSNSCQATTSQDNHPASKPKDAKAARLHILRITNFLYHKAYSIFVAPTLRPITVFHYFLYDRYCIFSMPVSLCYTFLFNWLFSYSVFIYVFRYTLPKH